jgi:Fic family protein
MKRYIYQIDGWPKFEWLSEKLVIQLTGVHQRLGRLLGRMESLGFNLRAEAELKTLTLDVLKNSEIEGEILNGEQVRSSIARRLGMNISGLVPASRDVEGVVEMMLDATQHFDTPLTKERLWDWHAALFPTGRSGMHKILVGAWRDDNRGPMQVVSGPHGHERVHFEAPSATQLEKEMKIFLKWFSTAQEIDPILKAGIAHLWFVTIHPFEDGNGRIARTITDMQLARVDKNSQRFYSMSAQIQRKRKTYYDVLEKTTKGTVDITLWLEWFLTCLDQALIETENTLGNVLYKARFWEAHATLSINERQRLMLNKLLDTFVGKLTSSKWAKITKCSQDTALRDILDLVERDILSKDAAGGRSTSYLLVAPPKSKE